MKKQFKRRGKKDKGVLYYYLQLQELKTKAKIQTFKGAKKMQKGKERRDTVTENANHLSY